MPCPASIMSFSSHYTDDWGRTVEGWWSHFHQQRVSDTGGCLCWPSWLTRCKVETIAKGCTLLNIHSMQRIQSLLNCSSSGKVLLWGIWWCCRFVSTRNAIGKNIACLAEKKHRDRNGRLGKDEWQYAKHARYSIFTQEDYSSYTVKIQFCKALSALNSKWFQ